MPKKMPHSSRRSRRRARKSFFSHTRESLAALYDMGVASCEREKEKLMPKELTTHEAVVLSLSATASFHANAQDAADDEIQDKK